MGLSRSEQMARIKGKHTSPERILRTALWRTGLRYRLHERTPIGKPDIVFAGRKVAIFIDGCFWHGCPEHYVRPRSRSDFWATKLTTNVQRDRQQTMQLEAAGWQAIRIWEHLVFERLEDVVTRIRDALNGQPSIADPDWRVIRVEVLDTASNLERRHLVTLREPLITKTAEGYRRTTKWKSLPRRSTPH